MASFTSASGNIVNRSPWLVEVRNTPNLSKQFSFPKRKDAEAYLAQLLQEGRKAKLIQLDTAFQLRLRRAGVKTQTITFDTYEQAHQAMLKMESDLSVSIVRDYAKATQTTLSDLMVRYRDEVVPTHKGGSVEIYRINRILRDEPFVEKKLAALTTEDLQDFITDRLTEVEPSTVDRDVDIFSQVLNYAADVWKIAAAENPLAGLRRPKYFNERDRRLSKDEERALLDAAHRDENPYVEAAIILAIETSMRRSELLELTSLSINVAERYAQLIDTKNGRNRKVPLSSRALSVLASLMEDSDDETQPLLQLSANALKIAFFRRILPAAGIEDLHFHDLRHEAISRLAESGKFGLIELQAISGHRDTRMLLRYSHLCAKVLAERMDQICETTEKTYFHRGRKRKSISYQASDFTQSVKCQTSTKAPSQPSSQAAPTNVIAFPPRDFRMR